MVERICNVCGKKFNGRAKSCSPECRKEFKRQYKIQWNQDNKDIISEQKKEYYIQNKEHKKEYHREYYIQNRESIIERCSKNNVERYNNDPEFRARVREYYGGEYNNWQNNVKVRDEVCQVCGSSHQLEAHHIIPKSQDPSKKYDVDNGISLCIDCHRSGEHSIHHQLGVNYSPVEFGVWLSVCKSLINR